MTVRPLYHIPQAFVTHDTPPCMMLPIYDLITATTGKLKGGPYSFDALPRNCNLPRLLFTFRLC